MVVNVWSDRTVSNARTLVALTALVAVLADNDMIDDVGLVPLLDKLKWSLIECCYFWLSHWAAEN